MKTLLSAWVRPMVWLLACSVACSFGSLRTTPSPQPPSPAAEKPTVLEPSPAPTATGALPPASPTPIPPTATPAPGTVNGSVCYPSVQNPPMTLYLENEATGDQTRLDIPQNQPQYSLEVLPGDYIAYALTVGTELAGVYSSCAAGAPCTDHQPLSFPVRSGQATEKIDLCDWYYPPGLITANADTPAAEPVTVTAVQKMNVFAGPGLSFANLGFAPSRASAPALGRSADSSWLQIKYPSAEGSAWIYAPLTRVSGNLEALPFASPETGPEQVAPPRLEPSTTQFSPTAWSATLNEGVVHFKGSIKDEQGRPVNGFSILADNGTWSVLSHPTGASHWYPDLQDGAWDIIITNATDAAGWWTLTVASYDCPDFDGGFNAQCKEFTRLSENRLVKIVYPDETVINADWVCHRDCDKGLYIEAYRP